MWGFIKSRQCDRRLKQYRKSKNKKAQLNAVLNNLDLFQKSLISGRKPRPPIYGFLHEEPAGFFAITEQGGGANVAATRLYVYPDTETETIYLLTLGDKSTQTEDISHCKILVKDIRANPDKGRGDGHSDEDDERGKREDNHS